VYVLSVTEVPAPGAKRARTRARLLEAAAAVIAERGFERCSLEAVAARAGMTRGAIYGNFRDKEALFLAVVAEKWRPFLPPVSPGASFAETMAGLAEVVIAGLPARRAAAVGAASFQLYALTHPEMAARVAAANEAIYAGMAAGLAADAAALPLPAVEFVRVAHALIEGLVALHALTPSLVDAEIVRAAFTLLGATPR